MSKRYHRYPVVHLDFSHLYSPTSSVQEVMEGVREVIREEFCRHEHILKRLEARRQAGEEHLQKEIDQFKKYKCVVSAKPSHFPK